MFIKTIITHTQFGMYNFLYNYSFYEINSCFLFAKIYLDSKLLGKVTLLN